MQLIPATSVILTDGEIAVLFTAWTRKDIEAEADEHFPDGGFSTYCCLRFEADFALAGWPRHGEPLPIRKHVVPYRQVCHILPSLSLEAAGEDLA